MYANPRTSMGWWLCLVHRTGKKPLERHHRGVHVAKRLYKWRINHPCRPSRLPLGIPFDPPPCLRSQRDQPAGTETTGAIVLHGVSGRSLPPDEHTPHADRKSARCLPVCLQPFVPPVPWPDLIWHPLSLLFNIVAVAGDTSRQTQHSSSRIDRCIDFLHNIFARDGCLIIGMFFDRRVFSIIKQP